MAYVFSNGTTPQRDDTRRRQWQRIQLRLRTSVTAADNTALRADDTIRDVKTKIEKILHV